MIKTYDQDKLINTDIDDIIALMEQGEAVEILYNTVSHVITLICGNKYCDDIREVKPVITSHSGAEVIIRWCTIGDTITRWKEYYIRNPRIYMQFSLPKSENNEC